MAWPANPKSQAFGVRYAQTRVPKKHLSVSTKGQARIFFCTFVVFSWSVKRMTVMLCGQSKEQKGSLLNRLNLSVLKVDRVRSFSAHVARNHEKFTFKSSFTEDAGIIFSQPSKFIPNFKKKTFES